MKSTKEKLDEKLGIKPEQTIDEFLDDISIDTNELSSTFSAVSDSMKASVEAVDGKIAAVESGAVAPTQLVMSDLVASMKEVEDLVILSKQMYKHIYENFCSSDLLDSELIGAAAKLLESIHINVKEFIDMYRDRQKTIDRIQQQESKFQHDIYMENLKHQHVMERLAKKADAGAIDAESGMVVFDQKSVIEALSKIDNDKG